MEKQEMTTQQENMTEQVNVEETKTATAQEAPGVEEPRKEAAPEVILQYREYEANLETVTERVKSHYYAKGYPADSIESMQIYVKPEDFTAYYVINDGVVGKVNLF